MASEVEQFRFRARDCDDTWSGWIDRHLDGQDRVEFPDDDECIEYQHRIVMRGAHHDVEVVSHDWGRSLHDTPSGSHSTWTTKDSGARHEFASGMVRDSQEGKARFDLTIPDDDDTPVGLAFEVFLAQAKRQGRIDDADTAAIAALFDWYEVPDRHLALEVLTGIEAVEAERRGDEYESLMLTRWAELMGRGAEKYDERNWEKSDGTDGALNRARGSGLRHGLQWWNGKTDEDHAAAVFFNVGAVDYYQTRVRP